MSCVDTGRSVQFQDPKRLKALFTRLDVNKDGKICSSDIMRVLEELHGANKPHMSGIAESFLMRCGGSSSGYVTFPEFVDYVLEHDKRLITAFDVLDQSKSGRLTADDIRETFKQFGMPVTADEAERLLKRVDQAGNLNIDYGEWREFLLFHPAEDVAKILEYWRHDSVSLHML
ncbi:unnamed protein product [Echinostoma caproni]|uniref:EF-hand domain-containing protein n=1 Tax=Echinostoma caproni TaxID=27848 RepID=A0A183B9Q9_9TREM|nr:unnamed protein product [Echinostoma caproni]